MNRFEVVLIQVIVITLLDTIVFSVWIYEMRPEPSQSIGLIVVLPFLIILNLIISLGLKLFKKKYSKLFLFNAILAPVLFFNLFSFFTDYFFNIDNTRFSFNDKYNYYEIQIYNETNTFYLYRVTYDDYKTREEIIKGKSKRKNQRIYLFNDTIKMEIKNDVLIGFDKKNKYIPLKELKY